MEATEVDSRYKIIDGVLDEINALGAERICLILAVPEVIGELTDGLDFKGTIKAHRRASGLYELVLKRKK